MADVPIQPGGPGARPIDESGRTPAAKPARPTDGSRPQFEALLERLEEKARALDEESKRVSEPGDLAGAVEGARSSLEDALSFGEELLEKFRQSQHLPPEQPKDQDPS